MEKSIPLHRSLDYLKEISKWVSCIHDVDRLLDLIINTANRTMSTKAGSLLLIDEKTGQLYFKVATGRKKDTVKQFKIELGQGIAGHVAATGTSLYVNDVTKDNRWFSNVDEATDYQSKSIACVPMMARGKVIGVVELLDKLDGTPFDDDDLEILAGIAELAAGAVVNAREMAQVSMENQTLKEALDSRDSIIGESTGIRKAVSDAMKVADSTASALILGESGTGKELFARLIHNSSPRKDKPLVALNCIAMPESLLEAELFGHEKGAFTGAQNRREGKFFMADGGTIFLDEIGEMSPSMQAKLLRVLQEGTFYRVGGTETVHVDVRVLSATNRNLLTEVEEGRFREDLFYRLNVVQIDLPPLREREGDIEILARHFADKFKLDRGLADLTISEEAIRKINAYDWPGNVRELRNAIERAVVMGNGKIIVPEDLPMFIAGRTKSAGLQVGLTLNDALNRFKKEFIIMNLNSTGGNRSAAAKQMEIQRTYLSSLISKFDIKDV